MTRVPIIDEQAARSLGERFAALHHGLHGGFIMPNAWDPGSAILLAEAGFPAIATTSAGIAFSLGFPDYGEIPSLSVPRDVMLARAAEIARAVDIPVNADLEAGYGDTPDAVADTVSQAIACGLAGANIEDRNPLSGDLYDSGLARERITAAVSAAGAAGRPFVLTARCDSGLVGGTVEEAIRRLRSYRIAGAACLYAPGFSDPSSARTLVGEFDAPLNFVAGLGASASPRDLLALGARRVSLGGSIARAALALVRSAAEELRAAGTIGFASSQLRQAELNKIYGSARAGKTRS
jgi:2-methylisocitrate lyase-like PEP mutase family enzyme